MIRAMLDEARAKDYPGGVIGLRGAPDPTASYDMSDHGQTVRVRAAESALAVREALAEHQADDWMVVITDRDDSDLGAGLLAHFIWQRVRTPDPWEAVRQRFAATGVDPLLTRSGHGRELATSLLAATPPSGWPVAPAGVLTRTHALRSVAQAWLGLDGEIDVVSTLRWSLRPESVTAVADLRAQGGDRLAEETLSWVAEQAGQAAAPLRVMLQRGEVSDIVPTGIVLHLLTSQLDGPAESSHAAELAIVRMEPRWAPSTPSRQSLRALGSAAAALLGDLVHDLRYAAQVTRATDRADLLLGQLHADDLAVHSDLLARGFRGRLVLLADELGRLVGPDRTAGSGAAVERAWTSVTAHRLGATDRVVLPAFAAAVRLARWISTPSLTQGIDLGALTRQQMNHSAWADVAMNDVWVGVGDDELAPALKAVFQAAAERRRHEERAFAAALAQATAAQSPVDRTTGVPSADGTIWYLEHVLPDVVIPLAKRAPVFLLVMDGVSVASATELISDATDSLGWVEAALPGTPGVRRTAGLAVLPSLTRVSRASLLCGRIADGEQAVEARGYAELTSKVGKINTRLFHKKGVDTTEAGSHISQEIGAALDDPDVALVTVILNSIDDALDRSDPTGTTWNTEAVKHFEPLLARARLAGRTVVLTADHGHVVERRNGTQRSYPDMTSGRSRPAVSPSGEPMVVQEGEVEVHGVRVVTEDQRAILAVDEGLRYGPLKAGYHGGASAAEVVVPIAVLLPDAAINPLGLTLLPPQVPAWWLVTQSVPVAPPALEESPARPPTTSSRSRPTFNQELPIFDAAPADAAVPTQSLGTAVVASDVYRAGRRAASRLTVSDSSVAALVDAAAGMPAGRLPTTLAAQTLAVNETRLRGALTQVQQLLNVEGYAVIQVDLQTAAVLLDTRLLREQFDLR